MSCLALCTSILAGLEYSRLCVGTLPNRHVHRWCGHESEPFKQYFTFHQLHWASRHELPDPHVQRKRSHGTACSETDHARFVDDFLILARLGFHHTPFARSHHQIPLRFCCCTCLLAGMQFRSLQLSRLPIRVPNCDSNSTFHSLHERRHLMLRIHHLVSAWISFVSQRGWLCGGRGLTRMVRLS